jgi:hypothetical protein
MKLYKVQDLGLPDRWSNFTVFSSEVSRLVLLSERGRTHGSIWGVPPFLEGILRATVATTMTTSYFYSYINTSSYQTTYTITIKVRQSRYSLTGEWWESNDGKKWYQVTSNAGRENYLNYYGEKEYFCYGTCCSGASARYRWMSPNVWAIANSLRAGTSGSLQNIVTLDRGGVWLLCMNWQLTQKASPVILYFRSNESVTVSGIDGYSFTGRDESLYEECWLNPPTCIQRVTEWGRTYKLQAIELVDWDTGEVYASLNQTSVTFNINRNTIVRFKYVLVDSWSRSWEVILPPKTPEPTPGECQQILNDPNKVGSLEWCRCASIYDPDAYNKWCRQSCLYVSVSPCCSGDTRRGCLDSWSGQGGQECKIFSSGTQTLSASWRASWSLKPGWTLADIGKVGPGECKIPRGGLVNNGASGSASGTCSVVAEPNRGYHVNVIVIFKKTQ